MVPDVVEKNSHRGDAIRCEVFGNQYRITGIGGIAPIPDTIDRIGSAAVRVLDDTGDQKPGVRIKVALMFLELILHAAVRALAQAGEDDVEASIAHPSWRLTLAVLRRPTFDLIDWTEVIGIATEVGNERVALSGGGPHCSAEQLNPDQRALARAKTGDAVRARGIEADEQHLAGAQVLDLAGAKRLDDAGAFAHRGVAQHDRGLRADGLGHIAGVLHAGAEDEHAVAFGEDDPDLGSGRGHQFGHINRTL